MEKRIRRPAGLTALFWRYLITTGIVVILLAVLWWFGMTTMMRYGIVYPANTAASGVEAVAQALSSGELDTEEIPYFYRWAIFDGGGQVQDPGNMDEKHLAYAEAALAGERDPQGMFYSQYHRLTQLPDGTTCVLQYDYSMPYGAEVLQRRLPEFQTCATVVLLVAAKGTLHVAHVGDSRAYLRHGGVLTQITMDHSYVQDLVNFGQITQEEARVHPKRNIITRVLGVHEEVRCDYAAWDFSPGDLALACSDGLSNYMDEDLLDQYMEEYGDAGRTLPRELIQYAVQCGGSDNITAAVIFNG